MPVISPGAFEPRLPGRSRDPDVDGISLYREACLGTLEECLLPVSADKRPEWGIVRLPVSRIRILNMSLRSVHDDRVAGHVVIPELSAGAFQIDRNRCKALMHELAVMASGDGCVVTKPVYSG